MQAIPSLRFFAKVQNAEISGKSRALAGIHALCPYVLNVRARPRIHPH
ncbi:hypothetical protein HMPREF3214_00494 [Alloscardovia omnicolens]|nr:hypothetical protein HMPREF3214_00494 [Alloscardovia omnicolens]